ncbi:MAG: hypothetical protein ABI895_21545, partial [Deltaproteobacteria bacterium]
MLGAALGLLPGCGENPAANPLGEPLSDVHDDSFSAPVLDSACPEGKVESCNLMLGEHDGLVSCYEGTRSCQGGVFGACGNGH